MSSQLKKIAVVGGGILGLVSALSLARKGFRVCVFESQDEPWRGASSSGEGKIHLGLVYPLGDFGTRDFLLQGALMFSDYIDSICKSNIDWGRMVSGRFTNVVMSDSLLSDTEIEDFYYLQNQHFLNVSKVYGKKYLGRDIAALYEPQGFKHPIMERPAYKTEERAINPLSLREVIINELGNCSSVELLTNHSVESLTNCVGGVSVEVNSVNGITKHIFDAVVNCAWENRARFINESRLPEFNLRYKTGISISRDIVDLERCDTVTMVNGPYGDIVVHRNHIYISWYPLARLRFESSSFPSDEMKLAVADALGDEALVRSQIEVFQDFGFLGKVGSVKPPQVKLSGGYILGEGTLDIDSEFSGLHSRPDRGVIRDGGIFSPMNYKFTTAPLMASRATEAIVEYLEERS
jgi:hypothetical protein